MEDFSIYQLFFFFKKNIYKLLISIFGAKNKVLTTFFKDRNKHIF